MVTQKIHVEIKNHTSRSFHLELVEVLCLPVDSGPSVQWLCTTFSCADYDIDGIRLIQVELTALLLASTQTDGEDKYTVIYGKY